MHQQVLVRRELRGALILRQEVPLLEIEFAQLGDAGRFCQDVGPVAEQAAHLALGLDVALLSEKAKALGIVEVFPRPDRQQDVVGLGIILH